MNPDRSSKIYRGYLLVFCGSNLCLFGQSRTPVPTMGMRVAEDVDPYKEESNILMRSPLSGGFPVYHL